MGRRGVVIQTALLIAMLLFALITATVTEVAQGYSQTRHLAQRTRATYLAKAAVNQAVASLNRSSDFETDHLATSRQDAQRRQVLYEAAAGLAVWIERLPSAPGETIVLLVHGRGTVEGVSVDMTLPVVKQDPATEPTLFGMMQPRRVRRGGFEAAIYQLNMQTNEWEDLEPIPTFSVKKGVVRPVAGTQVKKGMLNLATNNKGQPVVLLDKGVLATYDPSGVDPTDPASSPWKLTAIPKPDPKRNVSSRDLITDGHSFYYPFKDAMYRLDPNTMAWQEDVTPPGLSRLRFKDCASDAAGNVYLLARDRAPKKGYLLLKGSFNPELGRVDQWTPFETKLDEQLKPPVLGVGMDGKLRCTTTDKIYTFDGTSFDEGIDLPASPRRKYASPAPRDVAVMPDGTAFVVFAGEADGDPSDPLMLSVDRAGRNRWEGPYLELPARYRVDRQGNLQMDRHGKVMVRKPAQVSLPTNLTAGATEMVGEVRYVPSWAFLDP